MRLLSISLILVLITSTAFAGQICFDMNAASEIVVRLENANTCEAINTELEASLAISARQISLYNSAYAACVQAVNDNKVICNKIVNDITESYDKQIKASKPSRISKLARAAAWFSIGFMVGFVATKIE